MANPISAVVTRCLADCAFCGSPPENMRSYPPQISMINSMSPANASISGSSLLTTSAIDALASLNPVGSANSIDVPEGPGRVRNSGGRIRDFETNLFIVIVFIAWIIFVCNWALGLTHVHLRGRICKEGENEEK